jgi:hypothetical protein
MLSLGFNYGGGRGLASERLPVWFAAGPVDAFGFEVDYALGVGAFVDVALSLACLQGLRKFARAHLSVSRF